MNTVSVTVECDVDVDLDDVLLKVSNERLLQEIEDREIRAVKSKDLQYVYDYYYTRRLEPPECVNNLLRSVLGKWI